MKQLELKILDSIKTTGQYIFSTEMKEKSAEIKALNFLEEEGCISIKSKTIGYCVADFLI